MKKRTFILYGIVVFVIGLFLFGRIFLIQPEQGGQGGYKATLPVLVCPYGDGTVNRVRATIGMADCSNTEAPILPVQSGERINISWTPSPPTDIEYEILKTDKETVLHGTGDDAIVVKELPDDNREYFLQLSGNVGERRVTYTLRLYVGDSLLTEHLQAARELSTSLANKTVPAGYADLIPVVPTMDEGAAHVTFGSGTEMLTYGDLKPETVSTAPPEITDINDFMTSLVLERLMKAETEHGERYFKVREYFRIRDTGDDFYLLDYDRKMMQYFEPDFRGANLILGLTAEKPALQSVDGRILFSSGGELWQLDERNHALTAVFAMAETPEERYEAAGDYSLRPLICHENGDVDFAVIGRIPFGEFEGRTGIAYVKYNKVNASVQVAAFADINLTRSLLMQTIGSFIRLDKSGTLIFVLDGKLYEMDAAGHVTVSDERFETGDYVSSPDGTRLAYRAGDELRILYTEFQIERAIRPDSTGTAVVPVSFLSNGDLAYAIRREDGHLEKICIVNDRNEAVKEYTSDEYLITAAYKDGTSIKIERTDAAGQAVDPDYLLNVADDVRPARVIRTEDGTSGRVTAITLGSEPVLSDLNVQRHIRFSDGEKIGTRGNIAVRIAGFARYHSGQLAALSDDLPALIQAADKDAGVVRNAQGRLVWKKQLVKDGRLLRGMPFVQAEAGDTGKAAVMALEQYFGMTDAYKHDKSVEENLQQLFGGRVLSLKGLNVLQIMYYTQVGIPSIIFIDDEYLLPLGVTGGSMIAVRPSSGETAAFDYNTLAERTVTEGFAVLP
ncbi:MAG: hypothetical protein Q4P30_04440 [Eubacteriales bacterium]|nr:hypothetical protein [Eubacteriales bacterium]